MLKIGLRCDNLLPHRFSALYQKCPVSFFQVTKGRKSRCWFAYFNENICFKGWFPTTSELSHTCSAKSGNAWPMDIVFLLIALVVSDGQSSLEPVSCSPWTRLALSRRSVKISSGNQKRCHISFSFHAMHVRKAQLKRLDDDNPNIFLGP